MSLRWFDAHCHLQWDAIDNGVVDDAQAAGVDRMVCVGTDATTSTGARDIADDHRGVVWATAGVHPHDAASADLDAIEVLLADPLVVAVGECGFDFHYDHSPRDVQRDVFAAQVALAEAHDRTLVIHTRDAWDETLDVLASGPQPPRIVFHCFTGGPDEAQRCLAVGAHVWLSFSGIVSFKTAGDIRAAAAACPSDRLLVETDAPYLAPVPHRGKPNRPALLPHVGAALAAAREESIETVAVQTYWNSVEAFGLPPVTGPG